MVCLSEIHWLKTKMCWIISNILHFWCSLFIYSQCVKTLSIPSTISELVQKNSDLFSHLNLQLLAWIVVIMTVRRCQGNYLSFYHVATKIQFPPMRCQPPSLRSSDEVTPAIRHALWHRPRHNINTGYYLSRAQHILNRLASATRSFHPLSGNLLEAGIVVTLLHSPPDQLVAGIKRLSWLWCNQAAIHTDRANGEKFVRSHDIAHCGPGQDIRQSGAWEQRPDCTSQPSPDIIDLIWSKIFIKESLQK